MRSVSFTPSPTKNHESNGPPQSSTQAFVPPLLNPPENFGIVEKGVYRCSCLSKGSKSFLDSQIPDLKTVFVVEKIGSTRHKPLIKCLKDRGNVDIVTYEMKKGRPFVDVKAFRSESHMRLVKKAMEIVLDTSRHPVLICCKNGVYYTSLIVGCIRKIQNWGFSSIINESKEFSSSYSLDVFSRHFIERLDLSLLKIPNQKYLPKWATYFKKDGKEEDDKEEVPFWIGKKWSTRDALVSKDSERDAALLLVKRDD